ncbi:hypothetical protein SUS17_3012 [Sphingomonas sp. S17]|nr:hypothetical protein SUS17_3012 [Sphingomonas sp. S17]
MLRQQGKKEKGAAKRRKPSICDYSNSNVVRPSEITRVTGKHY